MSVKPKGAVRSSTATCSPLVLIRDHGMEKEYIGFFCNVWFAGYLYMGPKFSSLL